MTSQNKEYNPEGPIKTKMTKLQFVLVLHLIG